MEVRSETGVMANREPFSVAMQKPHVQSPPSMQNMRLTFTPDGTAVYKPITTTHPPPQQPPYQGGGVGAVGGGGGGNAGGGPTRGGNGPAPTPPQQPPYQGGGANAGGGPTRGGNGPAPTPPQQPPYQGGGGGGGGNAGGGPTGGGNGPAPMIPGPHGLNINTSVPIKKKRGRPRKYGPDGAMALALSPVSPPSLGPPVTGTGAGTGTGTGTGGFLPSSGRVMSACSSGDAMKKRGRPLGSGRKLQMAALGSAGTGFTPHVITVKAGEDVSAKIMSFSQNGPRAVCILSANGAISNVTLRQAATSGGTVTYEGRFEILSLSGSFLLSESGGQRSRTGGLSVSLAGPDGRVLGGGVAGLLTAASPVQVVVGSFIAEGKKEKQKVSIDPLSAPGKLASSGGGPMMTGPNSPPSRGTLSESSGGEPPSPMNQNQLGMANMPWK